MRSQNVSHIIIDRTDHFTKKEQRHCNKLFWLILLYIYIFYYILVLEKRGEIASLSKKESC
jgi:hypothetical protein